MGLQEKMGTLNGARTEEAGSYQVKIIHKCRGRGKIRGKEQSLGQQKIYTQTMNSTEVTWVKGEHVHRKENPKVKGKKDLDHCCNEMWRVIGKESVVNPWGKVCRWRKKRDIFCWCFEQVQASSPGAGTFPSLTYRRQLAGTVTG